MTAINGCGYNCFGIENNIEISPYRENVDSCEYHYDGHVYSEDRIW